MPSNTFISGGTGFLGRALSKRLLDKGHPVRVLTRPASRGKVTPGASVVEGDALQSGTFAVTLGAGDTFVHLTGVAHPAPWKEREFRAVDRASLQASVEAATAARVAHFVYVSVAHPAPVMHAYIQVRRECEEILATTGLPRTILRPWYVLGPGHRWPTVLRPLYALASAIPSTRPGAQRLGLVTLEQMTSALLWAVEHPPESLRVMEVPEIRAAGS